MENVVVDKVSVIDVAPVILFQLEPLFVLLCHCTVGVGIPVAATVNVTGCPAVTVWLTG